MPIWEQSGTSVSGCQNMFLKFPSFIFLQAKWRALVPNSQCTWCQFAQDKLVKWVDFSSKILRNGQIILKHFFTLFLFCLSYPNNSIFLYHKPRCSQQKSRSEYIKHNRHRSTYSKTTFIKATARNTTC